MTKTEFALGLEKAGWPAFLLDSSGTVLRLNEAAAAILETSVQEKTTRLAAFISPNSESSAEQVMARVEQAGSFTGPVKVRAKGDPAATLQAQACLCDAAGSGLWLLQLFKPVAAPGGKPDTVDASLAQKQKLDCALQLTRTVALDFNNALTSILGHTSLILGKMEPGHPWRGSLLEVEKSAEKAAEIAHDLAVFSRQEKDTRALSAGNLNELLRRTISLFPPSTATTIDWKMHLESRLFTVNLDEAKMQQAFMKILENAVQSISNDGRIVVLSRNREQEEPIQDGTVKLAAGCHVCVEISDNGSGIAPDVLPRIFEPFFTTKPGHRGLGLAWVYGIVTNHGGGVAVSSQPGHGTTVRVYLPAQKKIVRDKSFKGEELRGNQTILIVDDEDLLLTMGQMILSSFGYRVLTANSGQQALEILSKTSKSIDLVITDLVMPHMSGRELIEHIKLMAPETKFICSTGYVRSTAAGEEEEATLQKPFTSHDLLAKVKQVLTQG